MRSTTRFIAACWLAASPAGADGLEPADARAPFPPAAVACLACHTSARGVLSGPMATRASEKRFARRAFGAEGDRFFAQSCAGCHVAGCDDCHGARPHAGARLTTDACTRCHKGYFVGWDYLGRAPREDHARYQRGAVSDGEAFLKMRPDVHAERGMTCADCHTMRSLQEGRRAAKTCRECHPSVSRAVPEHSFAAHLDRMECEACHAAWAPQEYGTFLVRTRTADQEEAFSPLRAWGPWRKSAYLKRQDAPPSGRNERGQGRSDPAAVRPVRHRHEPGLGESPPGGGVAGLRSPHHPPGHRHVQRVPRLPPPLPAGAGRGAALRAREGRPRAALLLEPREADRRQRVLLPGGPPRGHEPKDAGVRPAVPEAMEEPPRSRRATLRTLILSLLGGAALWRFLTPRAGAGASARAVVSVPEADVPPEGALVLPQERVAFVRRGRRDARVRPHVHPPRLHGEGHRPGLLLPVPRQPLRAEGRRPERPGAARAEAPRLRAPRRHSPGHAGLIVRGREGGRPRGC